MSGSGGELERLAEELSLDGLSRDAATLREIDEELQALDRPPGLLRRLAGQLVEGARTQWRHLVGEVGESAELVGLIRRRAAGEPLSPVELDKVRTQLMDMVRMVPAGLLTAANSTFPIPGTTVFTPWLLAKLGLLPSRWREAHALARLEEEHAHLRALGRIDDAARIQAVVGRLEEQATRREEVDRRCALLTHWDADGDGRWDEDERAAYRAEVSRLQAVAQAGAHRKDWFLQSEGHVFGPVRLAELGEVDSREPVLVSWGGQSGWISLHDLRDRSADTDVDDG